MRTYRESFNCLPDFKVRYRFLSAAEGGRSTPPYQRIRWDFLYEGDDPRTDGIHMIWPEFISPAGSILGEGEVPLVGEALMFIVNLDRRSYHRERIGRGTRGFFVEGSRKVAECEVTGIHGLFPSHELDPPSDGE